MGRRLFACLTLFAAALIGLFSPPQATAQGNLSGLRSNSYTDPFYGFTVAWDETKFDAEELTDPGGTPFGVSLFGRGITASIAVGGYGDLQECLHDRLQRLSSIEGVRGIHESRNIGALEFGRDVTGAVYQYTFDDPGTGHSETYATYFGCEPLLVDGEVQPDVVLTHDFGTRLADFPTLSIEWVSLVDGITFAGEQRTSSDNHAGVNGSRYLDPADGWAVTWDASALTAENWVPSGSTDILGVQLTSGSGNFMTIFTDESRSLRGCVSAQVDQFDGTQFSEFKPVEDANLPKTRDDARAALFQGVFTSQSGDSSDIYLYVECRPLVVAGQRADRHFLVANLISDVSTYANDVPVWSGVLTSVTFDAAGATRISSGTYTSSVGFQLSWDDSVYVADYLETSNPDLGISLSSRDAFLNFQVAGDPTADACVSAEVDIVEKLSGMSALRRSRADGPEPGSGSASHLYDGTLTFTNGKESDVVVYIECRPIGEVGDGTLYVVVRMVGIKDAYADELPRWQDILDSITSYQPETQQG